MLRVAMLSKWHVHAEGYAKEFLETGKAEIAAVWDENPARGEEWAKSLGCDFEPELDALLARGDIDAVCCCTPTTMHKDVLIRAAKAGKHIFTEKTLACTVKDCREIEKAVEENRVEATCTESGKVIKACSRCGEKQEIVISALGHQENIVFNTTHHWYECDRCGSETTKRELHNFDNNICNEICTKSTDEKLRG